MRKNSARKWLHATLDLLPVVIIPIFALYATNKNATFAQEITVSQNKVVDFNQILPSTVVTQSYTNNGFTSTYSSTNNEYTVSGTYTINTDLQIIGANASSFGFLISGHKYQVRVSGGNANITFATDYQGTTYYARDYQFVSDGAYFNIRANISGQVNCNGYINLFDLTQMFGVGNEPSVEQFNEWFPNDHYDYTLSDKQLLKDFDQITYNDTDIGSQFIYGLYNSVDKYFNIGNVFNLGSIYDWLNLNIFNGNSPIAIYIVWNIVAYEFLMDLLFLLYGLFMFFIDTCTNLMDRFYGNLSGRR